MGYIITSGQRDLILIFSIPLLNSCDRCSHQIGAEDVERRLDRINDDLESIDVHDIPGLENFLLRYINQLK